MICRTDNKVEASYPVSANFNFEFTSNNLKKKAKLPKKVYKSFIRLCLKKFIAQNKHLDLIYAEIYYFYNCCNYRDYIKIPSEEGRKIKPFYFNRDDVVYYD